MLLSHLLHNNNSLPTTCLSDQQFLQYLTHTHTLSLSLSLSLSPSSLNTHNTAKMTYQQEIVQKQGFRKRWPILCFCLAAMFFIIGGGLLGAWVNSAANDQCTVSTNDFNSFNDSVAYSDCRPKGALWDAGIACLALGVIFKIAFWITLIICA
jgi:hypothetical protein